MLCHLPNTMFLGGARYRKGVQEIPEFIDGVPVVLFAEREKFKDKPHIPLPRGVTAAGAKPAPAAKAPATTTLSQMAKGKVRTALDDDND